MAEPFLCQGLWQIRDLKLSAGLRDLSDFLRRDAAEKNRKFLTMARKGYKKHRMVLCRLTVLLGGWQTRRQHTWLNRQGTGSQEHSWRLNTMCNIKEYEGLV